MILAFDLVLARRLRFLAASALVAVAVGPSSAAARTLDLQGDRTEVTDVSSAADGVVGPGDTVAIAQTVRSADAQPITGLTGTLSASTSAATVTQGTSEFPDLSFGTSGVNTTPFRAVIDPDVVCGQNVRFSLDLGSGADSATLPVTVATGETSPPEAYPSAQTLIPLADNGTITSNFEVTTPGRIKDARIHIGRIDHPYVGDLQLSITAPDGTVVSLVENRGGNGDDFVNTTFASDGVRSIADASAPFTGTFRPEGDLGGLVGHEQQGTWTLKVKDTSPRDTGVLRSWGGELARADCTPRAFASFVATPNQVSAGGSITFDGNGSRVPGSEVTRYEWDLDGDGTYETDTGATPTVSHSYPTRGNVVVGLHITGGNGLQGETSRPVAITDPPVASFTASPDNPVSGQSVAFDASASHDVESDGNIVRYEWDLDGDGSFETDAGTAATTDHVYPRSGSVPVRLRVTDNDGATSTATRTVTVANRAPLAALVLPSPAIVASPATFSAATSSDPDGAVVHYEWDLDGDPSDFELDTGSDPTAQRTFTTPGQRDVRVKVTDDEGATDVEQAVLTVTERPVARLSVSPKPSRPDQVVTLDASGSTDDGSIAAYAFDLDGNGTYELSTGDTPTTSKAFSLGNHLVGVRVTDDAGATATQIATVSAVNALPVAALAASANPATTDAPVRFDASASRDSDGTVTRFDWDLDGNGNFETPSAGVPVISFSYPNPGTVTVRVRVTDNDGGADIRSLALVINRPAGAATGDGSGETAAAAGGAATAPPAQPAATGTGAQGAGGTGASLPGPGAGAPAGPPPAFMAALVGPPIQSVKRATRSGVRLACRADRAATCRITAELPASEARRLGLAPKARRAGHRARPLKIAVTTVTAPGGHDAVVVLRLPARVRKALSRARRAQVVVRGFATDGAGTRIALSRIVLLRR